MERRAENKETLKFYIHTFGCQMNENDSEWIAGALISQGAKISSSVEKSDLVIINTCAVREKSEEKLYSLLGRLESVKKKKELKIGIIGCVAQLYRTQLLEKKPFIDFVIGPDNYREIYHLISNHLGEKIVATSWNRKWQEVSYPQIYRESVVSAYVTIMEGCNNFCSYCIVPFVRGREKYRPMKNILGEVKYLAGKGYKEIQLLGKNVNSDEDPESGKGFSDLLRKAKRINGVEWIRFVSSHPKNFSMDIARVMKESEKICHQLHLPVQSGSSSVLNAMNRDYTREEYLGIISMLRDLMPDISLSTDIIVGFPGETERDYKETLSLLENVRFTNIFSFRYSPRPLTAAWQKKDSVPLDMKKKRLIELQNFQKKIQLELNRTLIGRVIKVLCYGKSKKDSHLYSGRNAGYQVVNFQAKNNVIGHFVNVGINSCGPYSLRGEVIQI